MTGPRIGSLCSGYGGLDMAVRDVFGGEIAWFFEYDKAPSKILAHHWPDVPNYGDMTTADWAAIEPVDILCGGTPCQDLSGAGKRAGMTEGTRSNLWVQMREAIAIQRPAVVIWENVRGAYSAGADSEVERTEGLLGGTPGGSLRALGRVLGDLSSLGYEHRTVPLRASDVGAAHIRYRVFVVARDTRSVRREPGWVTATFEEAGRWASALDSGSGGAFSNPEGFGWGLGVAPHVRATDREGYAHSDSHLDLAHAAGFAWSEYDGDDGATGDADDEGLEGRTPQRQRGQERSAGEGDMGSSDRAPADPERIERERRGGQGDVVGPPRTGESEGNQRERDGHADGDTHTDSPYRLAYLNDIEQQRVDDYSAFWDTIADKHPYFISEDGTDYWPAVQMHQHMVGRPVPAPAIPDGRDGKFRYSPFMGEWMMGLDHGHVTDPAIGLTRAEMHKACGNGVVRQQARVAQARGFVPVEQIWAA